MFPQGYPDYFPQEIAATLQAVDRLQQQWPAEIDLHTTRSGSVYAVYPHLFLDAFPSLQLEQVRPLALAGQLLASMVGVNDPLLDGQCPAYDTPISVLRTQALLHEALRLLSQLFPPQATFWQHWQRYLSEYAQATLIERTFTTAQKAWGHYTEALAQQIAISKDGITRSAIAGLAELAHDPSQVETLTLSINHYNIARQMFDDLCDWKDDLRNGMPSLLLARVLAPTISSAELRAGQVASNEVGRAIYYEGHAHYVLGLALQALERAEHQVQPLDMQVWPQLIGELRRRCQALAQDIERIVQSNLRRHRALPALDLQLPPTQSEWQALAWDALRFLVREWQRGFGEARHIMYLPREWGFRVSTDYCAGDVFQRALILDGLCDAQALLGEQLRPVLDAEIAHLLECRRTTGVGGWSYFPSVPEIAPDADDLGQVMQALLRSGCCDQIDTLCEIPLEVLLHDASHPDGGFETWIVPAHNRTPEQERQAACNGTMWGKGPDNEVMANLLYALTLYDPARFAAPIQAGVAYLEQHQDADGHWASSWYYGPFYGTCVCLRLLAGVKPDSPAVDRAQQFLASRQHADGGWGLDQRSDPLSSALALLGLATAQQARASAASESQLAAALAYLQAQQGDDGGWSGADFIRPKADAPYRSRTLSTLFVLKATLAWNELLVQRLADGEGVSLPAQLTHA